MPKFSVLESMRGARLQDSRRPPSKLHMAPGPLMASIPSRIENASKLDRVEEVDNQMVFIKNEKLIYF